MDVSLWIVLLTQAVAATMVLGVFSSPVAHDEPRPRSGRPILSFLAWAAVAISAGKLWQANPPLATVLPAAWYAAASMSGVALKWLLTVVLARGREFRERSLACALIVSPLAVALARWALPSAAVPDSAWLWFANGVLWQTVAGDLPAWLKRRGIRRAST